MFANLFRKLGHAIRPDDQRVVQCGGCVWHLTASGAELFGPDGPDLKRWLASGLAKVVKSNPARTVYRVELPGGTIFIKHCQISGPRAWAREVIRPPKARLEFDNARALRERNVAAIEPLAWGAPDSRWPGESYLITRGFTTAIPFLHYLEQTLPSLPIGEREAVRRQLARGFGRFLARLHDAGVTHPDPHPGNLLVELTACRMPRFTLIDLHDVHLGKPLGWATSRDNLVLFNRWFQLRASRVDRARFWHAYRHDREWLPISDGSGLRAEAKELERTTLASNLRFWASRESRCLGSNRYFRKIQRGSVRGLAVRDLPDDFLQQLLTDPDAVFTRADARILKQSPSSAVVEIMMPGPAGPTEVILKRVSCRTWREAVKNQVRRSKVVRSWVSGHALRDQHLPTPRPLAVFHRYRHGMPAEGYLLTEKVAGAIALDAFFSPGLDAVWGAAAFAHVCVALARVLRAMHDRGVSHRDLKAANVLLGNGREPMLIDLVGVRTRVRLTHAQRAKELARLNASFLNSPTITRTTRLRFLDAYLRAGPALGVDWKRWWEMVSRATAAKVARNQRNGRALG